MAVLAAEFTREQLQAWGRSLGASLQAPAVVALSGDLGAGKTTLTQAICEGLGVPEPVTSPTYALVHEYGTPRGPVHHFDLYRLRDESQLAQVGWDDALASGGFVIVEWPERAAGLLPRTLHRYALSLVPGRADLRAIRQLAEDE